MDKKIIILFIVLGIILSGCKIAEKQTEEPVGTGEQGNQNLVNETVEEVNQTAEPEVGLNETVDTEEPVGINATEPKENVFKIEINHLTLSQKYVTIEKGTTVVWDNQDSYKHKLTIYGLVQSPILYQGDSFNYTFNEVGKYIYICAIFKRQIRGTINVEENP